MNPKILAGLALAMAFAAPSLSQAHFTLQSPASWLVESGLGDPQKMAPCGGITGNPGMPTGAITAVRGGEMLHIKLQETVFHPGHYRVSLAVLDRKELPADPVVMTKDGPKGPISVSAMVMDNPKPPVLVDNLWPHTERQPLPITWETDVKLPNINCVKCTLQIIEFMAEHGLNKDGDFSYHHCADLKITANPAMPIDRAWPGQR